MADYMIQLSYTSEAWATLIQKPVNRTEAIKGAIETLGGKMLGFWMSFGDHDIVGIVEMPNNVGAAAFAMALAGGGACKNIKTTPLLKIEDSMKAMKKAATCGYTPVTKAE